MKHLTKLSLLALVLFSCWQPLAAQTGTEEVDHSYKPLTLKLNDSGSKYVRFIIWNQVWARAIQNNPGTLDVDGNAKAWDFDLGARRTRFLAYAQISPRFLILTHWGINNQTFINGGSVAGSAKKPQLFIHDAWTEYMVLKDKLYLGAGLHYWNGISRLSSASTLNFMTLDAPIYNWPTIEWNDQFARQYGIYAKGQLGKLDYRIALNKPFTFGSPSSTLDSTRTTSVNVASQSWSTQGYFQYMFFDKESNKLPFTVGTHLGAKKVLNVGAGYMFHPNSMAHFDTETREVKKTAQALFGLDVFYEQPINKEKNTMFHLYSVFYQYNFGPNFVRNVGIMNEAAGYNPVDGSYGGSGNGQPTIGTGQIWHTQVGFLLPKMGDKGQFMPYATATLKNFEGLEGMTNQFDLGLNYFLNGHNAKLTLQAGLRPLIDNTTRKQDGYRTEITLQSHFFL